MLNFGMKAFQIYNISIQHNDTEQQADKETIYGQSDIHPRSKQPTPPWWKPTVCLFYMMRPAQRVVQYGHWMYRSRIKQIATGEYQRFGTQRSSPAISWGAGWQQGMPGGKTLRRILRIQPDGGVEPIPHRKLQRYSTEKADGKIRQLFRRNEPTGKRWPW